MLHRLLCSRAFRDKNAFRALKWRSTNPNCARRNATCTTSPPGDLYVEKGLQDAEMALEELDSDFVSMNAGLEQPSPGDEEGELAMEIGHDEKTISHAAYHKNDISQTLLLPETPRDWGNTVDEAQPLHQRRRLILRCAFLEATAMGSERGFQMISQAVKSESRLKAISESLYECQGRPLKWQTRYYRLVKFTKAHLLQTSTLPTPLRADSYFDRVFTSPTLTAVQQWQYVSLASKRRIWPDVMLQCLSASAEQSLHFLTATNIRPLPAFDLVMDALLFIRNFHGAEIRSRPVLKNQFVDFLRQYREPSRWCFQIEEAHLDLLLESCAGEEGRDLFEKLRSSHIFLTQKSLIAFMDFFTKSGDVDSALEVLNYMEREQRLCADDVLLSRCTNLLKHDQIVYDGDAPNFRILPRILEAGIKPNLIIHNLIMKNAVRLGAPLVAWDLYRYLQDRGLPTCSRTYLVLMQDALARGDSDGLAKVFTAIRSRPDLSQNPYLIACTLNVIRVVHGHQLKRSSASVFSAMLDVYCRAFSLASLRHLRIIGETSGTSYQQSQAEPNARTLAFVVWAYVASRRDPIVVESLFTWVEYLRSEGDKKALALTRCLPYYDGFILFFAEERSSLAHCLEIVRLMLDRGVEPSATTWGVILRGLKKHGQFQAAEELETTMSQQGVYAENATGEDNMHQQLNAALTKDRAPKDVEDSPADISGGQQVEEDDADMSLAWLASQRFRT